MRATVLPNLYSIENRRVTQPLEFGCVHRMDCLELLSRLQDNSIQCIFADPPFNLNKKYNSYEDNLSETEYFQWTERWIAESFRVLSQDGSFFLYNIPRQLVKTVPILQDYGYFRHWISWNSLGKPLGKSLIPSHYGILYYTKKKTGYKFYDVRAPHKQCRKCKEYLKDYGGKKHLRHSFGYTISDVWDDIHRVRHSNKRIVGHPCQLPPHLIERILLLSTDPDDTFVDLFAGGGSAGVAAMRLNRQYIGCDRDEQYVQLANEQISMATPTEENGVYFSKHLNKIVSIRDVDIKDI